MTKTKSKTKSKTTKAKATTRTVGNKRRMLSAGGALCLAVSSLLLLSSPSAGAGAGAAVDAGGRIGAGTGAAPTGRNGAVTGRPVGRGAPPHVMPFATRLEGSRHGPARRRSPVRVPVQVDGCDHAYGDPGQCVPWTFPPGSGDRCAWLRARRLDQLPVRGRDRHRLDPDRNGVMCDG